MKTLYETESDNNAQIPLNRTDNKVREFLQTHPELKAYAEKLTTPHTVDNTLPPSCDDTPDSSQATHSDKRVTNSYSFLEDDEIRHTIYTYAIF